MSRFSGRQGKGAMRILRDRKRAEAQERASHPRIYIDADAITPPTDTEMEFAVQLASVLERLEMGRSS